MAVRMCATAVVRGAVRIARVGKLTLRVATAESHRWLPSRSHRCAPATVPRVRVLSHLRPTGVTTDSGQRRVVVRVVAILVDLFPALFAIGVSLLALPPEPDAEAYKCGDDYHWDDHGNGSLATGAQAAAATAAIRAAVIGEW